MSSAVGREGRGKPVPDQGHVTPQYSQFTTPLVSQSNGPPPALHQDYVPQQQQFAHTPHVPHNNSANMGYHPARPQHVFMPQHVMQRATYEYQPPYYYQQQYGPEIPTNIGYDQSMQAPATAYHQNIANYPVQQPVRQAQPQATREKKILAILDPVTKNAISIIDKNEQSAPVAPNGFSSSKSENEPKPPAAIVPKVEHEQSTKSVRDEFTTLVKDKLNAENTASRSRTQSKSEVYPSLPPFERSAETDVYQRNILKNTPERDAFNYVQPPSVPMQAPESELYALAKQLEAVKIEPNEAQIQEETPAAVTPSATVDISEAPVTESESVDQDEDDVADTEQDQQEFDEEDESGKTEDDEEKMLSRERELDEIVIELLNNKEEVDESARAYGRSFLVAYRQLEKELRRTPCPLSLDELNAFGLDINAMPKGGEKKTTNFNPTWNTGNKQRTTKYIGRATIDGSGRNIDGPGRRVERGPHMKRPPPARPSIDRVIDRPKLPSSKNAWKPDRLKSDMLTDEEAQVKELCKKVRSLMNKITPTSKEELVKEFIAFNVSSNIEQLVKVVDIIFDKAIEEPKFCSLYAELCKQQVDHEVRNSSKKMSEFRNKILNRAQQTFNNRTDEKDELEAKLLLETDPAKKVEMQAELALKETTMRKRKFGNITFMGYLFRNQLLSTKIVHSCVAELLACLVKPEANTSNKDSEYYDEESIQFALQLIETLGAILDQSKDQQGVLFLDIWLKRLDDGKMKCSNKIRFMIMNIIELRRNKWIHRKSVETGPKKLTDIHKEIQQEQMENEKQRENYDRRHTGRQGGGPIRKNPPVARGSLENRQGQGRMAPPDQRRANAAASTKSVSSTVQPKKMSMTLADDGKLGSTQKRWHSGATGGGTTNAPESAKAAWTRPGRESSNSRKASGIDERQAAVASAKEIAGNLASRRSTSQNSIATDGGDEADSALSEEMKKMHDKLMNSIKSDIKEVCAQESKISEMSRGLFECVGSAKYGSPTLKTVFELVFRTSVEKGLNDEERKQLGFVLCCAVQKDEIKTAFIDGLIGLVKDAVETDMCCDFPNLWINLGELLSHVIHCPHDLVEGLRLAIKELREAFIEARKGDRSNKKFELLVTVFKKLAEAEIKEKLEQGQSAKLAEGVSWEFAELELDDDMREEVHDALRNCKPDLQGTESLAALLGIADKK